MNREYKLNLGAILALVWQKHLPSPTLIDVRDLIPKRLLQHIHIHHSSLHTHHINTYTHLHLHIHIPYMHIYTHVYPYTCGTQIHTSTTDIQYIYTHTHTTHISTHITVDIYPHHKQTNTFRPHAYVHTLHKYTHHAHKYSHSLSFAMWRPMPSGF